MGAPAAFQQPPPDPTGSSIPSRASAWAHPPLLQAKTASRTAQVAPTVTERPTPGHTGHACPGRGSTQCPECICAREHRSPGHRAGQLGSL